MRSLLLFLLALSGPAVWAEVLEGRVVAVADGAGRTVMDNVNSVGVKSMMNTA